MAAILSVVAVGTEAASVVTGFTGVTGVTLFAGSTMSLAWAAAFAMARKTTVEGVARVCKPPWTKAPTLSTFLSALSVVMASFGNNWLWVNS